MKYIFKPKEILIKNCHLLNRLKLFNIHLSYIESRHQHKNFNYNKDYNIRLEVDFIKLIYIKYYNR